MVRHVIKYEYNDGVKLKNPEAWCGKLLNNDFAFQDAQHVALAAGGSVQPCKKCIKQIIKALESEL
jgi:hypothetical protein